MTTEERARKYADTYEPRVLDMHRQALKETIQEAYVQGFLQAAALYSPVPSDSKGEA